VVIHGLPDPKLRRDPYAIYCIDMEAFYHSGHWTDDFVSAYVNIESARMTIRHHLWRMDWDSLVVVPCIVSHFIDYNNRGTIEQIYTPDFKYSLRMMQNDNSENLYQGDGNS
jgi:hypothetical protein